jgi:Cu2+-exporting ATPase
MADQYYCPMHPEVVSDQPGKCPKCGGMDLIKKGADSSGHGDHDHGNDHSGHDHASMMASPEAVADFLRRFFLVTGLLLPLFFLAPFSLEFFGLTDFAARPYLQFIIASIIFYLGRVFFTHAKHEIMARQYGMMTLVSLGVGSGYLFSALATFFPALNVEFYLEISTLIWVLLFGHFLEAKSSTAAGDALSEVAKLLPKKAHLKTATGIEEVDIDQLKPGDVVLVKAGEKVPADGEIIKGGANFNEAHLSGESKPLQKRVGKVVPAGAINLDGSVEIKLTRVGGLSTIGQIQKLISEAKQTKPSVARLADRASRWLTFSALAVAALTMLIWAVALGQPVVFAATLAITVLVIACPHALGLAIPTVSTIATRLAVTNGVFIKDMGKIEVVKEVDYVVFDKTGTLTEGKFGVTTVQSLSTDKAEWLKIVGAIETHSSHVIGQAILAYLKEKKVNLPQATKVKNLSGRGMKAVVSGETYLVGNKRLMEEKKIWDKQADTALEQLSKESKTPVFVASESQILGVLALSDRVKKESKKAIDGLHQLKVKVAMITGDTQEAAEAIATNLGIDTVFAQVLPEDKYKHIKKLQDEGNIVLMAGDGVNDAPALTQANVGVAIGAGTDVAVEAGDMVLTQSNPQHTVRLIVLARKVYQKMWQNLWWALGYNILAIPAAAGLFIPLGFRLTPAVGALLMSLSSVIVVINAMTLSKVKLA